MLKKKSLQRSKKQKAAVNAVIAVWMNVKNEVLTHAPQKATVNAVIAVWTNV